MKAGGTLLLLGAGAVGGYFIGREMGETEEQKKEYALYGVLIGIATLGLAALIIHYLRKGKHNTVNYTLHHKKRRVYDGICYDHRLDARINEHVKSGKVFDTVLYDTAKPRSSALSLETKRIKRFTPKYNIQHNPA